MIRIVIALGLLLALPNTLALDSDEGPTLHLVYVGGSACGMCKGSKARKAVRSVRQASREWAAARGLSFTSTGVADDKDVVSGWRFLQAEGPFDQVIIGRGFFNEGIRAFVASERGQPAFRGEFPDVALPQLLLFREHRSYVNGRVIHVERPVLLEHAVGALVTVLDGDGIRNGLDKAWPRQAPADLHP